MTKTILCGRPDLGNSSAKPRRGSLLRKKLTVALMALACASAWADAKTWKLTDTMTAVLESGRLTVSGTGAMPNFNEPNGAPWRGEYVGDVEISEGITSIGDLAFEGCYRDGGLSATIPATVTRIGYAAFRNCGMESVQLPSGLRSVGEGAFNGCNELKTIEIPGGVTSISDRMLGSCEKLTEVSIPSSVTHIGQAAFENCRGLTSVTIPEGVTHIGYQAFLDCHSLKTVAIPASVSRIGDDAFIYCGRLKSFHVDENNANYRAIGGLLCSKDGKTVIAGVSGDVTIPDGVTTIGSGAFGGRSEMFSEWPWTEDDGLTSLTIPESVTTIGDGAFQMCDDLVSLTIPSNLVDVSDDAFYGCTGLADPDGFVIVNGTLYSFDGRGTSVRVPDGVTRIGGRAFAGYSGLKSVKIPSSVTCIGDDAFRGCDGLADSQGFIIVRDTLYGYVGKATSVTIPGQVKRIGRSAFRNCSKLKSVTLPAGLTSIGDIAFEFCTSLKSVTIPARVKNIGECAFESCALTSVKIPASVTNIGAAAFLNLLKSFSVDGKNANYRAMDGLLCTKDGKIVVEGMTVEGSVTIPPTVTSIGPLAFIGRGVTAVSIPPAVSNIGRMAFYPDRNLAAVYVAPGDEPRVRSLMADSFMDVYGVTFREPEATLVKGGAATFDTGLTGFTVKDLPAGLSYDKKTGRITGTPKETTSAAGRVVTFMKGGDSPETRSIVVRDEEMSIDCGGLLGHVFNSGVVGSADGILLQAEAETAVKSMTIRGLPPGMKFDSKKMLIIGAPTKPGAYEVSVTVKTNAGNEKTETVVLTVEPLPTTAVGTFSGFVFNDEGNCGTLSLTTAETGKLTAKVVNSSGSISFGGGSWETVSAEGVYSATLKTKKGEEIRLELDSRAAWNFNQVAGWFSNASGTRYGLAAQRNAFGKMWYFDATGDETAGWTLTFAQDPKKAALAVTLKADGSTAVAGTLSGAVDMTQKKPKAQSYKVSASGFANVAGMRDGAIAADFAPTVKVGSAKKVLSVRTNLWFDRSDDHEDGVGSAKLTE